MTFKMYTYKGRKNVINKSLTHVQDVTGYFKNDTELINPMLILKPGYNVSTENYFVINGFHYFVTNVTYSQERLAVNLELDDLETYKTMILNQVAILDRSSTKNTFNTYQVDPDIPMLNSSQITITKFQNSFMGESLILAVAGGDVGE